MLALLGCFACAASACAAEEAATGPAQQDLACPDAELAPAPLRRLTRFEYANAARDVFGAELTIETLFPRDEVALGFDNQAGTLSLTDVHVQGYMEAAERVSDWLTAEPARITAVAGCAPSGEECARKLVAGVARRLRREPLDVAEVDTLVARFADDFSEEGFRRGVTHLVPVLLQDPRFLYRLERRAAAEGDVTTLASPWVLASRLAFLLWASVPDEALLEAAQSGQLSSRQQVQEQARRMLSDVRARRGVLHFYLQWLGLGDFNQVEKDVRLFKVWDDTLRADLASETQRFLHAVLNDDDARLETLLTARYSYVNASLADFYALPTRDAASNDLVFTRFAGGVPRAGLLTQGSILAAQAQYNQTDPIHRGKFIREKFFCQIPPPPPPDLVVAPPELDPRKSTRERFEAHRNEPSCAACHQLLDPVGFAFEHYDATGRYREREADAPIDATGYLQGTDVDGPLAGVDGLSSKLLQSQDVRRCVIKQWFRYGFGRGETAADACTLERLERAFERSGGDLRELVVALTQVDPFLLPAPSPQIEEEP